ncbi:polycystin-1-like isoform X2 [Mya arenaria]|uniref:polycystin-1-like isoform X2 n=1 Tax=Mya arenaria TaxID=6604 RepID=UPI0022E879FE|nr:polycystin-1-like isoform X2 [Mya arenaria]
MPSPHDSPSCQRSMRKTFPPFSSVSHGTFGEVSPHTGTPEVLPGQCCKSHMSRRKYHRPGMLSSRGSNVLVFGLLWCLLFSGAPRGADAQYTCQPGCTCDAWKLDGNKWTNVSCAGADLTEVPIDGKEGADVFKLDISNNNITSISVSDFQFFYNLVELDLSFNSFTTIPTDTFNNLTALRTLNLAGNTQYASNFDQDILKDTYVDSLNFSYVGLDSISRNMFRELQELKLLDLSHNNIDSLDADLFKNLNLEVIILSGNNLQGFWNDYIDKKAFNDLDKLDTLILSDNRITDLPKDLLKEIDESIKTLDLSDNPITSVSNDFLDDADQLTNLSVVSLDLSNCGISSLDRSVFRDVTSLTTLNLANNDLDNLHGDIFDACRDLSSLDLSSNQLSTISTNLFDRQSSISVDFSNNPFTCDCNVRDFLYELRYHLSKTLETEDLVKCTDAMGNQHVYLDYWTTDCSGNLKDSCTTLSDCMVRNADCDGGICVCQSSYYKNNGEGTAGGLCKPKVNLDYPCDMNSACRTANAECASSKCQCLEGYYDDSPKYLGGFCYQQVELEETCTMDSMCLTENSQCSTSNLCECTSAYYDDNGYFMNGGECVLKLSLSSSCNESYQCAEANSECLAGICDCSEGYHNIANSGKCQVEVLLSRQKREADPTNQTHLLEGADTFFSCTSNSSLDAVEVRFNLADVISNDTACQELCFTNGHVHYLIEGDVCLCGDLYSTGTCCPYVTSPCNRKTFLGPQTSKSSAGIVVDYIPQLQVGEAHTFSMKTSMAIINENRWSYGDSEKETVISSSASSVQHTFTHSGLFYVTVKACISSVPICEEAYIPVRVQERPANLTTYLTGYSKADVNKNLSDIFATFTSGYDFAIQWAREDSSSNVFKKQGCPDNWHSHRYSCIRLVTSSASSFDNAQSACMSYGGKLLQIDYMEELTEIVSILGASSTTFRLGGEKVGGVWQWKFDGSKTVFDDNDLDSHTGGNCVILQGNTGKLTSVSCAASMAYACMNETIDCSLGGTQHPDGYCYVMPSGQVKNWSQAQAYCESQYNGWLANITSTGTQTLVTSLMGTVSSAWFGLSKTSSYYIWADKSSFNDGSPEYAQTITSNTKDCFVTTSANTWTTDSCSMVYNFVCQYSENIERITVPSFVAGVGDLDITQGTSLQQIVSTDNFPTSTQTTEIYMMPGIQFSKSGKVRSWVFRSEMLGANDSFDVALQVYRPSCSSGTLYQPGCAGTKHATCSSTTYTCTTDTCSDSQYFCYLSNQCKFFNQSCTCNSEGSSATAACAGSVVMPEYQLVSQTQLTVAIPGENWFIVPAGDISVQPLDVIGFQFVSGKNVIKCENMPSGVDQQTLFKASVTGWLEKTHSYTSTSTSMDLTCYIQAIYTNDKMEFIPQNLASSSSSSIGDFEFSIKILDTETQALSVTLAEGIEDIFWVYPGLNNIATDVNSLGTVYTEYNKVYDLTVRVERGNDVTSVWSIDTSQTVTFSDTCSATVTALFADRCNASLFWAEKPFASFTYNTSTIGVETLSIIFSNILGPVQKTLTIYTDKMVSGLTFTQTSPSIDANTVALNEESVFDATISEGTNVTYSFKVGGSTVLSTNSTLFYTFTTIGTFIVEVTVQNKLGQIKANLTVYVKNRANFANCMFVNTLNVAAVGLPYTLTLQCDTNTNAQVKAIWELSDRSSNITGSVFATSSSKATFNQNVTFTSVSSGVNVVAYAQDPFSISSVTTSVIVYNQIPSVSLTLSENQVLPSTQINFTAAIPSSLGNLGTVMYTFDFGDGSANVNSSAGEVSHAFTVKGNYSVIVVASNGPSTVSATEYAEVYELISGLSVTYDGPKQMGSPVTFTASISTGNLLTYRFSSSTLFNVTQASETFTHTFSNAGDYPVTVLASNAFSSKEETIMSYIIESNDIKIVGLKIDGAAPSGCLRKGVPYNFSIEIIHYDATAVTIDWNFGNGLVQNLGPSSVSEGYSAAGNYTLTVTARYAPQSAVKALSQDLCIEEAISNAVIKLSSPVAFPSSGSVNKSVTYTVDAGNPVHIEWSTNATVLGTTTVSPIEIQFSSEGFYYISLNASNTINHEYVTKVVEVIQEISNLTIMCSSCVEKNGDLYVEKSKSYTYIVTSLGSQVSYSWDMGDSSSSKSGSSVRHSYSTAQSYTLRVTASSAVSSSIMESVKIYVEEAITQVELATHLFDWTNNLRAGTTSKNLQLSDTGQFKATIKPTSLPTAGLVYIWQYDTSLTPIESASEIGSYKYDTLGLKSVTVTASNSVNNVTSSPLEIYVIMPITEINVTQNGEFLSSTDANIVALNKQYTFTASSYQITQGSETYLFIVRKNGVLVAISSDDTSSTFSFNFTTTLPYSLRVSVKNSITSTSFEMQYDIEAITPISGAFINALAGEDGNITLGETYQLTGGSTVGKYPLFRWSYTQSPVAGEVFPSYPTNATTVTFTPQNVGIYVITLEVYNLVSTPQLANYTINVQQGVSGVDIGVSMTVPDALRVGTTKNFTAVVATGTGLAYNWEMFETGVSVSTSTSQLFTYNFTTEALYNVTLKIMNYASEGFDYLEIYSLNTVPTFNLQVTGGINVPSTNYIAVATGTNLTFSSDLSSTAFITFDWQVNSSSVASTTSVERFFSPADLYLVTLDAENKISGETNQQYILVQDLIQGLTVHGCNYTMLLGSSLTLTASQTQGTDIGYSWQTETLSSPHTDLTLTVQYFSVGKYSVNVTATNYVSEENMHCFVTYLGPIGNLAVTKSQYSFVYFPITFNVTGDYIDPANFTWHFTSGGPGNQTTTTPTLTVTFANTGAFNLTVVVDNGVSQDTIIYAFNIENLLCSIPTLFIYGDEDKTRLRSRQIEFSMNVNTNDCQAYTSENVWTIYSASSCKNSLTSVVTLNSSIVSQTPDLTLPALTLDYGSYCIEFTHQYMNTPVIDQKYINLTIVASDLVAIISGGSEVSRVAGSDLTLNGSASFDPDNVPAKTLIFTWECTQDAGASSGTSVCAQIKSKTTNFVDLTSLNLTTGDEYTVTLTVSAAGRTNGTTTQKIIIVSSMTPQVEVECISSWAYGHSFLTVSKSMSFEGKCVKGCTDSSTYEWKVIDTATGSTVNIQDVATTTGLTKHNFVLKPDTLSDSKTYTFRLEVTEVGTGFSQVEMAPGSKPSGGSCTVQPTTGLVPGAKASVLCQNFQDTDTTSGIYYLVKVISPSTLKEYIAYYGSGAALDIYLAPFYGTNFESVQVQVDVINDHTAVSVGNTYTVSFTQPTLTGNQTNKVHYIRDHMVDKLGTIINQNNPQLLVQYCTAMLNFLNDQSELGVGTSEVRMALREVIATTISGLPLANIHFVKQVSYAIELLAAYPEELSSETPWLLINAFDELLSKMQSLIKRGHDKADYQADALITSIPRVQQALQSEGTLIGDPFTLSVFGSLDDLRMDISSSIPFQGSTLSDLTIKTVEFSIQLMLIPLQSLLADENPILYTSDGLSYEAAHRSVGSVGSDFDFEGFKLFVPEDIITYTSYSEDSIFQLVSVSTAVNPYSSDFGEMSTNVLSTGFYDVSGTAVTVKNLPSDSSVIMYMFFANATKYEINSTGLVNSPGYNPFDGMIYHNKTLNENTRYETILTMPVLDGESMHVQVRVNFSGFPNAVLTAKLKKNGEQYSSTLSLNDELMSDLQADHRNYTFYIPPSEIDLASDVFKLEVESTHTATVFVGIYNAKCHYFDEDTVSWQDTGCVPMTYSIAYVTACKCDHMTSFGGTLFVSPDELDFTDLTRLDIANNPVAIITCSVLVFVYILLVAACRRMDILDIKRISLIPMCGKDGSFKYEVTVVTGRLPGAGTSAHVGIRLHGEYGKSARQHVGKAGAFKRNCSDTFMIAYEVNLGDLQKITIWHDNTGMSPSWYLSHVIVNDLQTDQKYYFFANQWLSLEMENGIISKEVKVAGAKEMNRFGHRMSTAMFNALADKHLWLSLLNRPAQSRFTRVQRLTTCFTLLFMFIGVNAMWYGLLKTSNEDLGWDDFGWEEIVLALVSNVMVIPFSIGIVFLFKKSRAKPNFLRDLQKPMTAQTLEIEDVCDNSQSGSFESSNTGAIPYDLERESTIDSVPHTLGGGLRRSRHVAQTQREKTDDSLYNQKPSVSVTNTSSESPLWNEDGILKWPDSVPSFDDGADSRPSTSSTVANQAALRQAAGKPGARKTIKGKEAARELLDELDKMENELKESETRSVRSQGSRRSSHSLKKPSMTKSNWGSLEDILQSDDESVADSGKHGPMRKRGSNVSQSGRKFNPRSDPRIGGGSRWPHPRESVVSATSGGSFVNAPPATSGITAGLRPGYYGEMTMESRDIQIPVYKEKCSLPPWCIYIAYTLCAVITVFSSIMVILYCFNFGYSQSMEWLLALVLSLVLSFLVIEPLKAFLIAVYVVAMFKNVEQDEDDDFMDITPTFDNSVQKLKDVKFKPIAGFALLQAKEEGRKVHRMNVLIRQFIAYVFYLWLLMVIVYVHFKYDSFLLTKHVENDFFVPKTSSGRNFTNLHSTEEFWDWTEHTFVDALYLRDTHTDEEHGYLLGAPRARLIRGMISPCIAADSADRLGASTLTMRTCHGEGQYDEDTDTYQEGWNGSNANGSWKHYSAAQLGSTHKVGYVATYPGGGYPQELGTSYYETLTIIQDLKEKGWVDLLTRAVIFEFSIYNPGTDTTAVVAILAEFPLSGGVMASYEIQSQKLLWFQARKVDPLMVLESILFLVVIYSWIHITLQIREYGKQFFKQLWNYYEILTTLMATVSIGMYIGCVVEATNAFNSHIDNQTGFTNFERTAYIHVGTRYLQAWLLFLLMYKVVKQLRFIKFMHVYEEMFSDAMGQLLGAGLIFVILLLTYAQVGYLMYGRVVSGFESVGHTINTLLVMIRGEFDFWPMLDFQPVFSHFYVYSYYAFAYGLLVAFVIAILQNSYRSTKSKRYFKSTMEMQDYEMVEFMLKRFKLWAGIQKQKPAFRHVRFPGLPSISSRSSSSYSNRSAVSLQSAHSVVAQQEFSQVQLNSMLARMVPTWNAVLQRMDKIESIDKEEENLVKKAENEMKDLNWKCRINKLEREAKEILDWKNKPPAGDGKQGKQTLSKRPMQCKDNSDRRAPATVTGATARNQASAPSSDDKGAQSGRRPLSDQGARVDAAAPGPSTRRTSNQEKSTLQKFLKTVKPSKAAWNK